MRYQHGSATIALAGSTAFFLLLLLAFASVVRLEIGQLKADTAAHAAATGAIRALRAPVMAAAEAETAWRLAEFWREVNRVVRDQVDEWERSYRAARRAELEGDTPALPPGEISRIISDEVSAQRPGVADSYRRAQVYAWKPTIAADLLAGRPIPLELLLREFLSAADRGCLIYRTALAHENDMQAVAEQYVARNGAGLARRIRFSTADRAEVATVAQKPSRLLAWDDFVPENLRYVSMPGVAHLDTLAGLPLEYRGPCRKE